jgi:hypothetical protein
MSEDCVAGLGEVTSIEDVPSHSPIPYITQPFSRSDVSNGDASLRANKTHAVS